MTSAIGIAKKVGWRVRQAGWAEAHAAWRRKPVDPQLVLYEAFAGKGMLCNPEAIFRYLLSNPDFRDLKHVWAVREPELAWLRAQFEGDDRVAFVAYAGVDYLRVLATAGYLVNNATFPGWFSKRPGQTYLNTWHGTPLKTMGYAMPGGAAASRNVLRNFLAADFLLSSGEFMTEQMYATDYRLRNLFTGRVIEDGSPRTDRQFETGARQAALAGLEAAGLGVGGRKIALFTPTWRGKSFDRPDDQVAQISQALAAVEAGLDEEWAVLLKVHQSVYEAVQARPEMRGRLVPNRMLSNEVLAATDLLVCDYSSMTIDYLLLDRPVVFYLPDRAAYAQERGLYPDPDSFPGPIADSLQSLTRVVGEASKGDPSSDGDRHERTDWVERYAPHDDGHVTARVVDVVFGGSGDQRVVRIAPDGRTRILIYVGPMKSMGITTSAINLLSNIDYDRFDVTALYLNPTDSDQVRNVARIDGRVRQLPKIDGMNGSKLAHLRRHLLQQTRVSRKAESPAEFPVVSLFRDEWIRSFGDAEFDYVIDFSGYGPLWDLVLLQGRAESHSIWLHNDMYADSRRKLRGRRPLYRRLHSVFSTYRFFDHLVSVSKELREVNARQLSEFAAPDQFTHAHNTIDYEWIRAQAAIGGSSKGGSGEAAGETSVPKPGVTTFVTVGRLSPEKNHERLIRGFAEVHCENPDTQLVVIGDGPKMAHLNHLTTELGVENAVHLVGFQRNPYRLLAGGDCFVLSSDHEGQPMVILEALVLGVPVVITDFSSSRGALPPDTGVIVERSVTGIAEGMRTFLAGGVPNPPFDPVAYNERAMSEFYAAIGAQDPAAP